MSATVLDRVKKVTCEELGVSENEVVETASFVDDLGADSLDLVELVMAFEEEFSVDVPDDDAANLKTVGQAVSYINEKIKAKV